MPRRLWDLEDLELDLVLDLTDRSIRGTATHRVKALGRPSDVVRLHQEGLDIDAVTVDGEAATYRIGPHWIDIRVKPADAHTVSVRYAATPELGLHFRSPEAGHRALAVWSQGEGEDNRFWFPSWDYPNEQFTMTAHLTVRDGLEAWANGDRLPADQEPETPVEAGWTRMSYRIDQPITNYHVAVVAGDYRALAVPVPDGADPTDTPMEVVGPASFTDAQLLAVADDAARQMGFYEALLGQPFPYPVYRQAWVEDFMYGGMENPGLTTLAARRMGDPEHPGRHRDSEGLISHELAHQWFGDLVTCYGWRELWLNEGFATYYSELWTNEKYGPEAWAVRHDRRRRYGIETTRAMAPRGYSFDGRDNAGVYVKGATVLHLLRTFLGPDVYDEGIRQYLADHRFRLVESEDLRRSLEDVSGRHLGWLFDQYVHGTGMPSWEASWAFADGALTATLVPTYEGAVFHHPMDIEVDGRLHRVWLGEGPTKLVVPLDAEPDFVGFDPQGMVIGTLDVTQTAAQWASQLAGSVHPYARVRAMQALADEEPDDAVLDALIAVLDSDSDPTYRAVAVASLGELAVHPDARDAVLKASRDPAPQVREAALDAMENTSGEQAFASRLIDAAARDADPRNRASALYSLASHDPDRAVALARKRLKRPDDSPTGIEHTLAMTVLREQGVLADALEVARFTDPAWIRRVRSEAIGTMADLWAAADDSPRKERVQERARQILRSWLDDPDYRTRQEALYMLGTIGTDADHDLLEAYATKTAVGALRDAAREAIRRSDRPRSERTTDEELDALRKRIDALDDRQEDADERLRRLEEWR
jgi:aminopeptidase N